jgi:hypothetical protein
MGRARLQSCRKTIESNAALAAEDNGSMHHEEALIKAFFEKTKRERYLEMVAKPKKRIKFLRELYHFKSLDPQRCFTLPKGVHTADEIATFLRRKGAPPACWVTCTEPGLDGQEMPLLDALKRVLGCQFGVFLSCVPGRLAYFEDEDGRWTLEHND